MSSTILFEYLKRALQDLGGAYFKDSEIILKCNICGDSRKKSSVRRGGLFKSADKDTWLYHCFNGGCPASNTWTAERWLRETSDSLYKEYLAETFTGKTYYKDPVEDSQVFLKKQSYLRKKASKEDFIKITESKTSLGNIAKDYCKTRKIPSEVWTKFYICSKGRFKERLIIPFFNNKNIPYYYIGRTLTNQTPKYLNKATSEGKPIYNIDHIDKSKPVIVTEGVLDSIFIENSVSILGVKLTEDIQKTLEGLDTYYLFDSDKAGSKSMEQLLLDGKKVFLWSLFKKEYSLSSFKEKLDINDSYIYLKRTSKFTFDELSRFFTNNYFDRIYL